MYQSGVRASRCFAVLGALVVATATGCSGGSPASGAGGSGGRGGIDAGDATPTLDGTTASDATDAATDQLARPDSLGFDGTIVGDDMTCHSLVNTAPWILAVTQPDGSPIPELHGGAIASGRYELVAVERYLPEPGTGWRQDLYRRTVDFGSSGGSWVWTVVDVAPNTDTVDNEWDWRQQRLSVSLSPTGTTLAGPFLCAVGGGMSTYGFEATANTVTMWFESGRTLLHYLRVP